MQIIFAFEAKRQLEGYSMLTWDQAKDDDFSGDSFLNIFMTNQKDIFKLRTPQTEKRVWDLQTFQSF